MKKVTYVFILLLVVVLLCPMLIYAEDIPNDMLTPEQKAYLTEQEINNKVETYGKWVGLGQEVGKAVDSSLAALTDRAEKLANTKVGIFVMFIVALKVCGFQVIQILIGIPMLITGIIIWLVSFRRTCIPHSVVTSKEGPFWARHKTYEKADIENSPEYLWAYYFALVIFIGICMLVTFVH